MGLVRLFVNNVDWNVDKQTIKDSFAEAAGADIIGIGTPVSQETGKRKKFIFLIVRSEDEKKFLDLSGAEFSGRRIFVSRAKNQEFKPIKKIEIKKRQEESPAAVIKVE